MLRMMFRMSTLVALSLLSAGCERQADPAATEKPAAAASEDQHDEHDHAAAGGHEHSAADGHGHAEDGHDEHAGHDHGDDDHAHGGAALDRGTRAIGEYTVRVVQFGPATDDAAELVFEIDVDGTRSPDAVRVLVRNAEGAESLKVRAVKAGEHTYDAHVGELPANLARGGVLVVELESASAAESGEFELGR